jgi:glycosyltransferase involved in cell wall biosynthesis
MILKKLVIFDDYFPNLLTTFRVAEYNFYLENYNCDIYSTLNNFIPFKHEYLKKYPNFIDKINPFVSNGNFACSLFYTVFINNAHFFLPIFEKENIPFVFTLYPGGGFWLNNNISDEKLYRVCKSPLLKKIIVTQNITYNYLLKKKFCSEDKIAFIYGGVLPSNYFKNNLVPKKRYKQEKKYFDICFVAHKYMVRGLDKGYDIFIEVAKNLHLISEDIRFHIVGNFDKYDIDISKIKDKIFFYGIRHREFFPDFYSRMDIILSPNKPFQNFPGKFDGFPTGACIEAGMNGVAIFCTDELNLNFKFQNKYDICIISLNVESIVNIILEYFNNLGKLYNLSINCQNKVFELYNFEEQMAKRINILNKYLE